MAKKKLSLNQKIVLSTALAIMLVATAVISLVLVLAANNQKVDSAILVTYQATEVSGDIEFAYRIAEREYVDVGSAHFDGSETTTTGEINIADNIPLSSQERYAIFRYKIKGHSDGGFNVSLEYTDKDAIDKNNKIEYVVSDSEITDFSSLSLAAPVGTITKNNHRADNATVWVYVKVSIADLTANMNYDGAYNLVLSRDEWVDPNYDEATGLSYGLIEVSASEKYAALVDYDGSASEITITTTDVYGEELPVKVIRDYAFANVDPSSMATATPLTKVEIGDSVERVEGYAFAYNTTLTEAKIGKNVTYLAKTAFYGCTGLAKVKNDSKITITADKYNLPSSVEIVLPEPLKLIKDPNQFNNRDYYYVEIGEYPQTFAGYESDVTGMDSTRGEVFKIDFYDSTANTFTPNTEYLVYEKEGERYIKHKVQKRDSDSVFSGTTVACTDGAFAYFKIEPIKWDVVGYYTDDTKATFIKASDATNFNPNHTTNLVVQSRTALQTVAWNLTNVDVDYNTSTIYSWVTGFYDKHIKNAEHAENIQEVTNQYTDSSATSWAQITGNTAPTAGSVKEHVWIMDYNQANTMYNGNTERKASPSDFAIATKATCYKGSSYVTIHRGEGVACYSWLRSSFFYGSSYIAGFVYIDGSFGNGIVSGTYYAVRPALLINL